MAFGHFICSPIKRLRSVRLSPEAIIGGFLAKFIKIHCLKEKEYDKEDLFDSDVLGYEGILLVNTANLILVTFLKS